MSGNEAAQMMADGLSRILAGFTDAMALSQIEKGKIDPAHQSQIDDLGFDIALVPENLDGAGLGWSDVAGVFEVLGYYASPVDLGEQIIARWAMAQAGIAATDICPAVAVDPVSLTADGNVDGKILIPWVRDGQPVLAEVKGDSGVNICLIAADQLVSARPADTVGRIPSKQVVLKGAKVMATGSLPGQIGLGHANAFLRAGYISGALAAVLEMTIEYCNTRTQFGRPIGKFQAIQQLVAQLASEAAAANAAVLVGGAGLDANRGTIEVAVAKQRTSSAVAVSAAIAHEAHGAIGVTEEHILHYYTRRLWQWRDEAGSEHVWSERLGRAVIADGREALWPKFVSLTEG